MHPSHIAAGGCTGNLGRPVPRSVVYRREQQGIKGKRERGIGGTSERGDEGSRERGIDRGTSWTHRSEAGFGFWGLA